jgi:hypothetical protein
VELSVLAVVGALGKLGAYYCVGAVERLGIDVSGFYCCGPMVRVVDWCRMCSGVSHAVLCVVVL